MPNLVRFAGSDDWSALYVDGHLDRVGDHYLIDDRIAELAGVQSVSSDAFLRGGNSREDVAKTLEDITVYENAYQAKLDEAEALRARAAELEAEAKAILDNA